MAKLTVLENEEALARAAAARLTALIERAIEARASAIVSLTGGSTPRRLYALLADHGEPWRERIDWTRVHLCWGDERHVPPDHPDSNFGMAHEALVRHVPIPPAQVHRMRGELSDAEDAARQYAGTLREAVAAAGRRDQTVDLMLLGLGEDAHIASIFPGSDLLRDDRDDERRVAAVWAPHLDAWRITLTPTALLDARAIVMVVAGEKKAAAVAAALREPVDIARHPAQLLREAGDRVEWFVDRAAAAALHRIDRRT